MSAFSEEKFRCNISINSIIPSLILVVTAYYKCTLVYLLHNRAPRSDVARGLTGLAGITTGCSMEHLLQPTTQSEPWSSLRLCVAAESLIRPLFVSMRTSCSEPRTSCSGRQEKRIMWSVRNRIMNWTYSQGCELLQLLVAMRILSVRLSGCQTRALWQNGRKIYRDFYTIRKII